MPTLKPFFVYVSSQEILFFTKHLSTMIKAGIPLAESLANLKDQAGSDSLKYTLNQVHAAVTNGQSLSVALAQHPMVFNKLYCALIAAAEKGGTLEESLSLLAVQLNKSQLLYKKIQSALMYPSLVVVSALVVGGYLSLFILPQLVSFFNAFESELPFTTQILLGFATLMKSFGGIIVLTIFFLFVVFNILVNTKSIKPFWHKVLLRLPIFGDLFQYTQLARFSRNLSILLKSGVPIVASLKITANTLTNLVFQNQLVKVADLLTKGTQMGDAFEKLKITEFPPLVYSMIGIGEKTGRLDEMLEYLADFYEEEIDSIIKNFSALLEPVLLIAIGLLVGFVAVAIISPIYELTGSLRG